MVRLEEGKVRVTYILFSNRSIRNLGGLKLDGSVIIILIFRTRGCSCKYDKETVYPIKREAFSETLSDSQLSKDFTSPQNYFPESNNLKTIQNKT